MFIVNRTGRGVKVRIAQKEQLGSCARYQMDPRLFEPRILKVTKEALAEGVKLSEIARQLAPLISRTRLYKWVERWEKQGKL